MNEWEDLKAAPPHQQVWLQTRLLADSAVVLSCDRRTRVFQEGPGRSKDQVDGTGMSLGSRKGVRVTGRSAPPVDWNSRGGGPCIIHSPAAVPFPPEPPTVISIGPLHHRSPGRADGPQTDGAAAEDEWTGEGSPQSRAPAEVGFPRQTMEELKTILRKSPLLSIRGRVEGKPGAPYTYLHGQRADGSSSRAFSTFKPGSEASRRGPSSREDAPIQPSHMDASSSFRADANTNVQPHTPVESSSWRETAASRTGPAAQPRTDSAEQTRHGHAFPSVPHREPERDLRDLWEAEVPFSHGAHQAPDLQRKHHLRPLRGHRPPRGVQVQDGSRPLFPCKLSICPSGLSFFSCSPPVCSVFPSLTRERCLHRRKPFTGFRCPEATWS